jgi:hypothetical protein
MTTTKSKIVQLDMPPPTLDELSKMLSRAFSLGQTYWQQADSESYSQNRKSDATLEKFRAMQDGFLPAIVAYGDARAAAAVLAEREKMLADIRAEIALEGFGCACTPNKSCGTCIARRTLLCALDPLLRRYEAAIRTEPREQK